jgi:hypothetical protein
MSQSATAEVDWRRLAAQTGLYPAEAFQFVRDGLNRTSELVHGPGGPGDADRHVSGQQLWNVHRTDDFGRIVFAMIDAGLFSKSQRDSLDDFRCVFDFQEAFSRDRLVSAIGRRGHA